MAVIASITRVIGIAAATTSTRPPPVSKMEIVVIAETAAHATEMALICEYFWRPANTAPGVEKGIEIARLMPIKNATVSIVLRSVAGTLNKMGKSGEMTAVRANAIRPKEKYSQNEVATILRR
jgi:hypothetical protein